MSQPAWVVLSQKNQYLKYAIAYVGEHDGEEALVGPRFLAGEECMVQAAPTDDTQTALVQHVDFKIDAGVPCPNVKSLVL